MKLSLLFSILFTLSMNCGGQLVINELSAAHSDRLLVRETGEHPRVGNTIPWVSSSFDDSLWASGDGPFGFGDLDGISLSTNLAQIVQNRTPSLYLRKAFNVSSAVASDNSTLSLSIRYSDGFIAYLNGVEIARHNMGLPGMFAYRDQPAYNSHASTAVSTINLGSASSLLQTGDNLLSIQVHNQSASGSGSLLLAADLKLANGTTIADGSSSWKYFAGLAEPSGGLVDHALLAKEAETVPDVIWAGVSFDDSTWQSGTGPVGYDDSTPPDFPVGVDLQSEMRNITPSVYVRSNFTVTENEASSAFPLSLEVDYDDGMIVYLNGFEVFRGNLGNPGEATSHDATANSSHAATGASGTTTDRSETFTLDEARNLLLPGNNVIAIQLHNSIINSSDLIGKATLRSTGASPRDLASPTDQLRYFIGIEEPSAGPETENSGIIEDSSDSENDWIEIHNTSANPVSLDGWALTDESNDLQKWRFPSTAIIPPNGYYLVIASALNLNPDLHAASYPHTNFKLSASGERIILTRPDGQVADALPANYPAQNWRYTYGRQSDGTFGYLSLGTPGDTNTGPALGVAPALPAFSTEGGFHPESLSIVLTSSTPGSIVRYTTDGSDPLWGTEYTSPISVSTNTVIRARSFLTGSIPSKILTHTYLINQGPVYQSLPAMCFSGDLAKTFYGPNSSGGPADGEGIFAINGGSYSNGNWTSGGDPTAFNNPKGQGRPFEKPGALEYLPLSGTPLRTELGLRVAGSNHTRQRLTVTDPIDQPFSSSSTTSTKFEKPSFNIFFRPEFGDRPLDYPLFGSNTVTEFESLRVRAGKNDWYNPFIKDELMRRIFINTGQIGSYGTFNTVWINGVYKGYYNLAERVREGFMQSHFNSDQSWDVQQVNDFSSGDPTHWNEMIDYLRSTNLSTTQGYAGVHDYLDVDNYIDYILVNSYAAMGDWPNNNWIASRERTAQGRWRFFVWDAEGAFGFAARTTSTNMFTEHLVISDAQTTNNRYVPAIYTLLKDSPEFRLRMADRAQKQLFNGGALVTSEITAIYDELKAEVSPIIEETVGGTFRTSWYTGWIANSARRNALFSQLQGQNAWPSTLAPTLNQHGGIISQGFQLTLGNNNSGGTIYFTTDGSDPRASGGGVAGVNYSGAISLDESTRVRARVFDAGNWSPEIDVDFSLPLDHPTFLPTVSADWTADINWSSSPSLYPNGSGVTAVVPGVPGSSRNADLRAPVTLGSLIFDLGESTNRTRVRDRDFGNTLTFSRSSAPSEILVTGDGQGFAEVEVEAGTILTNPLRLNIQHENGDPDYGGLRLRSIWNGPGGLTKTGLGIATLTGSGKTYSGPTFIERGVLQISEPAAPSNTSSITVIQEGQLRLSSGTGFGDPPRNYAFGGPLYLSGDGRGVEIPDNAGKGKRGALRYEPGNTDNHAIIASSVELTAPATIHVANSSNQLELLMPLGGAHSVTKSGGGSLILSGDQSTHSYPFVVESGTLDIRGTLGSTIELSPLANLTGHGKTAAIGGEGSVTLIQTLLEAPSSNASHYSFVFGSNGSPQLLDPSSTNNSTAILENAPTGILALDFYLTGSAANPDAISQGGFIVPFTEDLADALSSASIQVFSPDPSGAHQFQGQPWSPVTNFSLSTTATELGQSAPFAQVRILELTNGEGSPNSFTSWQQANFNASEIANPLISGPLATPNNDGVTNLFRYAFGIPDGAPSAGYLPSAFSTTSEFGISFPFDSRRSGIIVTVESTDTLHDWSAPTILFNSNLDFPPPADNSGRITLTDPNPTIGKRFYRVRVTRN